MKEGKGEREHTPGMVNQYIDHIMPASEEISEETIEKLVKRKGK
jgi:hypothetical protein